MRSQKTANKNKSLARRLPFYTFALGLTLGVGVASPLSSQLGGMMAGLIHAPDSLAAIVEPIGIGKRLILVLGTDEVGGNTDVMFTVQIDGDTTRVTQVPRDTYIETPDYGVLKANALYGLAGPDIAKSEVSRLLSVPVERHLKVNLDAVARLADALGGVEVDVPKRMYYVDNAQGLYIDLYPGLQVLKGEDLEGFLRYRNDELGDLGRMDRQKLVLREVFRQLSQPGMLARLPSLLKIAVGGHPDRSLTDRADPAGQGHGGDPPEHQQTSRARSTGTTISVTGCPATTTCRPPTTKNPSGVRRIPTMLCRRPWLQPRPRLDRRPYWRRSRFPRSKTPPTSKPLPSSSRRAAHRTRSCLPIQAISGWRIRSRAKAVQV